MKENSKTLTAKEICKKYSGKQLLKYNLSLGTLIPLTIIGYTSKNEVILGSNDPDVGFDIFNPLPLDEFRTCENRRFKYSVYLKAEEISNDVQQFKAIAQYRNLTLGRLTAIKNSLNDILTNSTNNSLYPDEKEALLFIRSAIANEIPSMRYNSRLMFNKKL